MSKQNNNIDEHEDILMESYSVDEIKDMINNSEFSYREIADITGVNKDWLVSSIKGRIKTPNYIKMKHVGDFLRSFKEFKDGWQL